MSEGRQLQARLRNYNLTYAWLITELLKRGINTDKTELSSAFSGTRSGDKVDLIFKATHMILDEYESKYLC